MKTAKVLTALWCLLLSASLQAQSFFTVTSPSQSSTFQGYDVIHITWNCSPDVWGVRVYAHFDIASQFQAGEIFSLNLTNEHLDYFISPDSIGSTPRTLTFEIDPYNSTGWLPSTYIDCQINPSPALTLGVTVNDTTICRDEPVSLIPGITGGTPPYQVNWVNNAHSYYGNVMCIDCDILTPDIPSAEWYGNYFTGYSIGVVVKDAAGHVGYDTMRLTTRPVPEMLDTLGHNWGIINWGFTWPCGAVANPDLHPNPNTQPQITSYQWLNAFTGAVVSNTLNPDFAFAPGYNLFVLRTTDTYGCSIALDSLRAFTFCDNLPVLANDDCIPLTNPDSISSGLAYFTLHVLDNDVCDTTPIIEIWTISNPAIGSFYHNFWSKGLHAPLYPWGAFGITIPVANLGAVDSFQYVLANQSSPNVFDTAWVRFNVPCVSPTGLVWPGDADNNGYVDNADLLAIGVGYNSTGPQRAGASISWTGQSCQDWSDSLADGTNYKFADCNGNGTINAVDTVAIQQNFFSVHPRSGGEPWRANAPALSIQLQQDTLGNNDILHATISLGDAGAPATNIYGIAFDVNYDVNVVDTNNLSIHFGDSWLGTTAELLSLSHNLPSQGIIKAAVTRFDHAPRNGQGVIATADFLITTSNINGKDLSYYKSMFSVSQITMIDAEANHLDVNGSGDSTVVGFEPTGIHESEPELNNIISVFPNPAKNTLTVSSSLSAITQSKILNLLGEELIAQPGSNSHRLVLDVSGLSAGLYVVQINSAAGVVLKKVAVEH